MDTATELKDEFLERCKDIGVPRPILSAAWHQVTKHHLTMIVIKKERGDINMWFRDIPWRAPWKKICDL